MKASSLALAFTLLAIPSQAAIVASGLRDIAITADFTSLYLDIDGGGPVAENAVGWDVNPFFGGEGIASSPQFHPVAGTVQLDAPIFNLMFNQEVGPSAVFASTHSGGFSSSETHVGDGVGQFASGSEGYIGFRFTANGSAADLYGWMRVVLSNSGGSGLVREWAFEDTGAPITVGAVPEPGVMVSLLFSLVSLCHRRRRRI